MTDGRLSSVSPVTVDELFAAHENAEAIRKIREWCDGAESVACGHVDEEQCRRREAIKDCGLAVRALLPSVSTEESS